MQHFIAIPFDLFEVIRRCPEGEPCAESLVATIHCYSKGQIVATCSFFQDGLPLPANWFDGARFQLMYPWSDFEAVQSKIREKQIHNLDQILRHKSQSRLAEVSA